jgi:hypothetical protein
MRKQQITAVVVTLSLAVPFAALALVAVAWIDDNLARLMASLASPQVDWQALIREAWSRWPEVLGMLVGMGLIVVILVLAREAAYAEKKG